MPRLTVGVRAALIDLDGRARAAVVAETCDGAVPRPIGIARLADAGDGRADLAIAVIDAWQRRGVGRQLLTALRDLATNLGYAELSGDVLPENDAMQRLARRVFPLARPSYADGVVRVAGPLGAAAFTLSHEDLLADLVSG